MVYEKSLCDLEGEGYIAKNFKEYKKLVRHGRFVCQDCGRVARNKRNLCIPKKLYPKGKAIK